MKRKRKETADTNLLINAYRFLPCASANIEKANASDEENTMDAERSKPT